MHQIVKLRVDIEDEMKELCISHGYRNTVGEIFLLENEALGFVRGEDGILIEVYEELTSKSSRFDAAEYIYIRVLKMRSDNKIKEIFFPLENFLLYKTIKLKNPGDVLDLPVDYESKPSVEKWTILSIEEIEKELKKLYVCNKNPRKGRSLCCV